MWKLLISNIVSCAAVGGYSHFFPVTEDSHAHAVLKEIEDDVRKQFDDSEKWKLSVFEYSVQIVAGTNWRLKVSSKKCFLSCIG